MGFFQFAQGFCFKTSAISVVRLSGTVSFSIQLRDKGYTSQVFTTSPVSADTNIEAATVMRIFRKCYCQVYPCIVM